MENKINFIGLASYCQNRFKEICNSEKDDYYIGTVFVSISKDNVMQTSSSYHILENACQCLLIHKHSKKAISNWYEWYSVEFIDNNGCVHWGDIGDYSITIYYDQTFANQVLRLKKDGQTIYSSNDKGYNGDWEDQIKVVWKLYLKCKECETTKEACLLGQMVEKDQNILSLSKEVAELKYSNCLLAELNKRYDNLLSKIEKLVNK